MTPDTIPHPAPSESTPGASTAPFPFCPHAKPPLIDNVCCLCFDWQAQDVADALFAFLHDGEREP